MHLQHRPARLLRVSGPDKIATLPIRQSAMAAFAIAWMAVALVLGLGFSAAAHEVRPMIATFVAGSDDTFDLTLSLNLEAAMVGIEPGHDTRDSTAAPDYDRLRALPPDELHDKWRAFAPAFLSGIHLTADGNRTLLTVGNVESPETGNTGLPRISTVVLRGDLPVNAENLSWRLDPRFGDSVIRIKAGGADDMTSATYVAAGDTAGPLIIQSEVRQPTVEVFLNYVWTGFTHILPKGLDHILFVVGLFLLSPRLKPLLWQVSAFTVAHTITIALGTLGLVAIRPEIVEPLIALSIVWIAVENLFTDRLQAWRPLVVFGFGLLHGLGFAGVLAEIGLPDAHFITGLIAFNIGVELGQLAVIALCLTAVGWAMNRPSYRRGVVIPASAVIAMVAISWTIERVGLT